MWRLWNGGVSMVSETVGAGVTLGPRLVRGALTAKERDNDNHDDDADQGAAGEGHATAGGARRALDVAVHRVAAFATLLAREGEVVGVRHVVSVSQLLC